MFSFNDFRFLVIKDLSNIVTSEVVKTPVPVKAVVTTIGITKTPEDITIVRVPKETVKNMPIPCVTFLTLDHLFLNLS